MRINRIKLPTGAVDNVDKLRTSRNIRDFVGDNKCDNQAFPFCLVRDRIRVRVERSIREVE